MRKEQMPVRGANPDCRRSGVRLTLTGYRDRFGPWLAVSQPFGLGYPSRRLLIPYLIIALLWALPVYAEQIKCLDTLAAAQYGEQLKHIPVEYGVRGFARKEFGDFFPVAKRELERGRPWVGANLLWSDTHSFGQKDMPFVLKEAKRYQILCAQYPGKVEIATFTEHNLQNPDKYHDQVAKVAPDCIVVNSVWKGAFSRKYKNEVHGSHPRPPGLYNYSYDGTNSADANVVKDLKTHAAADVFCMWHPRLNLRWRDKDTASRAQRVKESKQRSPNRDMLWSLQYLFLDPGLIKIPGNFLIKSHAERHQFSDLKGDKLLVIAPVKGAAVELKRQGVTIARLPYYGSFEGGGYRYYWNRFGYQAGPNLDLYIGKKKYGTVNGGFRTKPFRN